MEIIGRAVESDGLKKAFDSGKAELIIMYGRRRIGKTFLVEQLYGLMECHFFHVTGIKDASIKTQLKEFVRQIGKTFFGGIDVAEQSNWLDAFHGLDKAINIADKNKKIVIFLDEIPWLCTPKSGLMQAIEYYWNRYWKDNERIKFVICGSSASWMIKKIINNKGGLHNRHTLRILLKPFKLHEVKDFLTSLGMKLNNQQVAELYMVTGGVPYYLSFFKKGMSAAQATDAFCFQDNGLLFDEFDKLFESLFDDAESYKTIVRTIATKREGASLTYIGEKLKQPSKGGALARRLQELEDAAFIKSFIPLGHKKRMKFYRVIDEYCYFYLQWIEPAKEKMLTELTQNTYWQDQLNSPEYYNWRGYAFESLCYKHLAEINNTLGLGRLEAIGAWRYSPKKQNEIKIGAQIDLIFDRADGITTICEIKYTGKPFVLTSHYKQVIQNKIAIYKEKTRTRKHINVAFISANGLKESYDDVDYIVTLDDLFKDNRLKDKTENAVPNVE